MIIFITFIILSSIIIFCFIKIKNADLQIAVLESSNKNLSLVNDTLRCFKHDFSNIMQAMNGYIALKDLESLRKYFNKLLDGCHTIKTVETLNPGTISNPALYSILTNKYQIIEKHNIKMNIDVLADLAFVQKEIYDISIIFGILLDNAIEAAKDCDEKLVNITFCKENSNKHIIVIENTYHDTEIDIEMIFQKNYTTKKNTKNCGLGLWEVRKRLNKNTKLDLYTTKTEKLFKQQIEIFR